MENMEDHSFNQMCFYGEDGKEVPFDALKYKNFAEAQAAMDLLEKEHGSLNYKTKVRLKDFETITGDFLIQYIELAVNSRTRFPWAQKTSKRAFFEFILPYRGSNEPISNWRQPCLDRCKDLIKGVKDLNEAAKILRKDVGQRVRFSTLYYLHPTDQGYEEMINSGLGRCEDISNMISFTMRAHHIPVATDYTPFWANRDNNHAWEVMLDSEGNGRAGLSNRAAKVYRKMFSIQKKNLGSIKTDEDQVPRWLSGKYYLDVTSQYMTAYDVGIDLDVVAPKNARFAYICVFNGGEWRAVHWSRIKDKGAVFYGMGPGVAYLPAYYSEKKLVPAAAPFILTDKGLIQKLAYVSEKKISIKILDTAPQIPDADTQKNIPRISVKPGGAYELFVWKVGEWLSLGRKEAADERVEFSGVSEDGLFWFVKDDSRRLERIFTIKGSKQIWW